VAEKKLWDQSRDYANIASLSLPEFLKHTNLEDIMNSTTFTSHLRHGLLNLLAAICATSAGNLHADGLGDIMRQNMAFDQRMNSQLQGMMTNNQMQQQQLVQSYIQQYGPQLRQQYRQYVQTTGMQVSFEQFVYSYIMTAGGTNPGPALQQQQRNFEAGQKANRTLQQGYDSYNRGWQDNSRRTDNAIDRFSNQAIRGNAPYTNPATGEVQNLPYTAGPGYYQQGGNTYRQEPSGQYYQVEPNGYEQELAPASPGDE
jgi:hypothetical protein